MRKSFALVAFAMLAVSLVTVPAPADECGLNGQMWISSGRKQLVPPEDLGPDVPDFPNGVNSEATGRFNLGGYGCDLQEGIVVEEGRNIGLPGGVGSVPVPRVATGPIDDEMPTNFITPGATHFTYWVRMERNCDTCPIPKDAEWYWDTNSSGTMTLGGKLLTRCARNSTGAYVLKTTCWANDIRREEQFRSGLPIPIPPGAYRIRVIAKITDEETDAFDDFKTVDRYYMKCQSWDPRDLGPPVARQVCLNQI